MTTVKGIMERALQTAKAEQKPRQGILVVTLPSRKHVAIQPTAKPPLAVRMNASQLGTFIATLQRHLDGLDP